MGKILDEAIDVLQYGTDEEKHTTMHVVENISIEMKTLYENNYAFEENLDFIPLNLRSAMKTKRYIVPPPKVQGSCGATSSPQSNDIFRGINYKKDGKKKNFEFNEPGPCRLCGSDVSCGPCKICEPCNNKIDANELAT